MSPRGHKPAAKQVNLTNLEVFVLAAVRAGLTTPYVLNKQADLSVGATIPLLARLKKRGMVSSEAAPRRSQRYAITQAGSAALQANWRQMLHRKDDDFDSLLRAAYLAVWMGAERQDIKHLLREASEAKQRKAAARSKEAQELASTPSRVAFGRGHRWMRAYADTVRLRAEATALKRFALLSGRVWV